MHGRVYSPPMRSLLQVIEGDLVAILEHQEEAKQLIDQIHSLLSSVSFNKHTYHSSYCFVFVMIFIKYIMPLAILIKFYGLTYFFFSFWKT